MSTPSFLNKRSIPTSPRSFHEQAQRAQKAARRVSFEPIEGQFNSFYPRKEKALWFAICPDQAWTFDLYDREAGEVVRLENQYYMAYVNHRVAVNKRNFQCSAGAHKDKPCWGCGIRNAFYDAKRIRKEATGIDEKGEAPISAMVQYAFAGVLLENIAKVPQLDKNGRPRTTKAGNKIFRETPITLLPKPEREQLKASGATTFGLSVHYSCGITHLNALLSFDADLMNYCANCGDRLTASYMACPECGGEQECADEEGNALEGQTMREARETDLRCDCGYVGRMLPLVECKCGNPEEGKLVDFALRLFSEKVSDTQTILKFTEVRPIKAFIAKYPHIEEMLATPLKLDEIFAPTRLEAQQWMVPENLRGDGVSPAPKAKKDAAPPAEEYPLQNDSDEEDDD